MRIAVIEDEAPIRDGIAKILERINPKYKLAGTAKDGEEGYELVRKEKPDLIIMDIQMPKLNGLEMLKRLRKEGVECRALVLTAYSDFNYAKQAIELGIENYLLKPIKIRELKEALSQIEEKCAREQSKEAVFSLDNIFMGCLNGQLHPDEAFHEMTKKIYGFTVEDRTSMFILWLGESYEQYKAEAREKLEHIGEYGADFSAHVVEYDAWELLVLVLYKTEGEKSQYAYFQSSVVPMLCSNLKCPLICIWSEIEHMTDAAAELREIQGEMEWNLLFDRGVLIRKEDIENIHPVPLRYPIELEEQGRQAVLGGDREELKNCYYKLYDYFREEAHTPKDMKENLIRYNLFLVNTYKTIRELDAEIQIQEIMQGISKAISWRQIRREMEKFFQLLVFESQEDTGDEELSALVRKAKQLTKRYYDQGITLEEIAGRLFVTEEYLSRQFKKETGKSFSETVRGYRIEKVKKLLLNTHLKLNQIAELAGYSDPKYMSKVFKEEVGVLPNEFRKAVD